MSDNNINSTPNPGNDPCIDKIERLEKRGQRILLLLNNWVANAKVTIVWLLLLGLLIRHVAHFFWEHEQNTTGEGVNVNTWCHCGCVTCHIECSCSAVSQLSVINFETDELNGR